MTGNKCYDATIGVETNGIHKSVLAPGQGVRWFNARALITEKAWQERGPVVKSEFWGRGIPR